MTRRSPARQLQPASGLAYFPLEYYVDFLEFLARRRNQIEVLTYADLNWSDDWDYENNYPQEHAQWKADLKSGRRDPDKIYVLLQHDVDDRPERTHAVLQEEERLGIRSAVMIFNRRFDRQLLERSGQLEERDYPIDVPYLQSLEEKGWVIGYHSNAYEQSVFDPELAESIFIRDVAELRERFRVEFFCPHGGARDSQGRSNAILELPAPLRESLRWTLNRHTPRFNKSYSDGAIASQAKDLSKRDLREFVRQWRPGRRYRVLTHPQYYDTGFCQPKAFANVSWYDTMVAGYTAPVPRSAWEGVLP